MRLHLSNLRHALLDRLRSLQRWQPATPCSLCGAPAPARGLCSGCWDDLPWLGAAYCDCCAHPLPFPGRCGRCLAEPPQFDTVIAACRYTFPVDGLIQAYKYGGRLAYTTALAAVLAQPARPRPDLIVPMPLADRRLRERGFNQALELARDLGRRLAVPVDATLCVKTRDTAAQTRLPWQARRRNIRGAFVVQGDVTGRHVAVVDDVLTTGATLHELARNLKRAGATRVSGYVIARTVGARG